MAFPQVSDYNTTINGKGTTHTVNLPSTINAGDLLVAFLATDGDNTTTWPNEGTDWIQIFEVSDVRDIHLSVAYRIADGNEGASISVESIC